MSATITPAPPAPVQVDATAGPDPRQLAADLERAVLPLPPAERQAVLARLVALAADPPANGHPASPPAGPRPDNSDRAAAELVAFEKQFPSPDPNAQLADCRWLQDHWGTPTLEPYRGTHVAVFGGRIVGHGDGSIRFQLDLARALNVHPQRLVVAYIDPPGF